jgi:transcriptional regulator with XRE-family HTH domain
MCVSRGPASFRHLPITASQVVRITDSLPPMEARSLPEALNMIKEQRGCSQSQLGRDLGTGHTWVSETISGKRGLDFAKVINVLARVGWEVVIRPKREKAPVKRREFVAAAASVMFVPSPKVGPYEDPTNVRELARRVSRARHEHGGGATAATAMRHIRRIESVVAGRDRQLQEAASELAVETVWTLNDARRFDAGENVGRLALELAKRSQSADAQSCAYSALAAINMERGGVDRALIYARDGVKLPEVPEVQQAWMRLRKVRSLALVRGQEHASRDEMESVQAALRDQRFSNQSSIDIADMMHGVGIALNDLGAYAEAHRTLNEAVILLGSSSPYLQGWFLAEQVIASLRMAEVSLAADHMLALAQVAPLVDSRRLDDYLRALLAESARWATAPEIRDAREQLRQLAIL